MAGNNVAVLDGEDENNAQTSKGKFSGFAALGIDVGNEEEEEDFGGLMVCIICYALYLWFALPPA